MTKDLTVAVPVDRKFDGKAMASLTDRQRLFVLEMLTLGINAKACCLAAARCGYASAYGYELMRNEHILAAIREEATKRVAGAALVGINVMLEIAHDLTHKDRYKAAKDLAALNGFTAEQRIVVEHISEDSKAQMRQIRDMAAQLGLDPEALIRQAGIIDVEFTEVTLTPEPDIKPDIGVEIDSSDW